MTSGSAVSGFAVLWDRRRRHKKKKDIKFWAEMTPEERRLARKRR